MATVPAAAANADEVPEEVSSITSSPIPPQPTPRSQLTQPRGDVQLGTTTKQIAKSGLVWGTASTGADAVIRGGTVSVKSLQGKPLAATVITKKTNKNGFFAVSRLGLPKRFVVQVAGGKVALKTSKKTKHTRSNAKLMAAVPKSKKKVRNTRADVTIGTTVAARIGIARWHNAAKPKAIKLAKKTLGLPVHAKLGTYDRLLKHYVSAHTIHKQAKSGKRLAQLIDKITKKAKKGKRHQALGQGERAKYRPHRAGVSKQVSMRAAAELDLELINGAIGLTGLFDDSDSGIEDALDEINEQLTEINSQLQTISTQLSTLQDEVQTGISVLSLQMSQDQLDTLNAVNNSTASDIQYAMSQVELLINVAQSNKKYLLSYQEGVVDGALQALVVQGTARDFQQNLVGSSSSPGLLETSWNEIQQQRATPAPATAPAYATTDSSGNTTNYALAATELITHENYDVFEPVASQWYTLMQVLAALTVEYAIEHSLGADDVWEISPGQLSLSQDAQGVQDFVMNGMCSPKPSPCANTFNSYLQVLRNALPSKTIGPREALDTTTGTIWGNFGTASWNSVPSKPDASSPDLDMPPTAVVTCNDGSQQTIQLDQTFFATVNGTPGNCQWPNAPVGGPSGSGDIANDWQMLTTDSTTSIGTFNATLGKLDGSGGAGLYSQVNMGNTNQNANPGKGIQGAHFLDFTYPSIFPATDWGRLSYAGGQWSQYMWPSNTDDTGGIACALSGCFGSFPPLTARTPHRDFLAFDLANPQRPDMTSGIWVGPKGPGYGIGYAPNQTTGRFYGSVDSVTDPHYNGLLTDRVAGFAAPWHPSANLSVDGNENSAGPPTPGCASYDYNTDGITYFGSWPSGNCVANIIGTRQATTSDYVWTQPASIG